jgi:hypothetical protein
VTTVSETVPPPSGGWRVRVQGVLGLLSTQYGFAIFIGLYLAVLFVLRITLFPGASEDDAETLFLSQSLEGGYKPGQPPLYIWLAYGLTQAFGPALPVIVALKFACLGAIYLLTHRLARLFASDGVWAALAGLSVLGIYYLSWDAVLNYSQTVLLAALVLAFVHALVRIAAKPRPDFGAFIWLGSIAGAGVMTKYNFAVLAGAVLTAAVFDSDLRGKLRSGGGLFAALIAIAIAGPHIIWVLDGNVQIASLAHSVPAPSGSALVTRMEGLADMVVAIISVLSPLLILLILFFPRAAWRTGDTDEARLRWRRLCERAFWFLLALVAMAVLVSGVGEVRNHWFIVLAPFPAYAVLRIVAVYPLRSGEQMSARISGFACVMGVLGLVVGIGVTARALTLPANCTKCKMVVPYAQLADGLTEAGFTGGTVYVYDYPTQVGGNLRRFFPKSRFVSYKSASYTPPSNEEGGQCLAIWLLGAGGQSPTMDAMVGQLQQRLSVSPSSLDSLVTIDVVLSGRVEPLRYGYVLINDPTRLGACR